MSLKDASERIRRTVDELTGELRGTTGEGRKALEDLRPGLLNRFIEKGGPVRKFLEERPTILLREPPIKRLRKRRE